MHLDDGQLLRKLGSAWYGGRYVMGKLIQADPDTLAGLVPVQPVVILCDSILAARTTQESTNISRHTFARERP
eukprot:108091-Amphidinium_carterae.1